MTLILVIHIYYISVYFTEPMRYALRWRHLLTNPLLLFRRSSRVSMWRQLRQTRRRKNTWASQKARLKEDSTAIGNHSKTAALEMPRSSVNTYGT